MPLDLDLRVRLSRIDRDGPELPGELQPAPDHVDGEDARRAEELCAHESHQAHRPGPDHGDGVARADHRALGGEHAGGEDVADEDRLLVADAVRDRDQVQVRVGHHAPLCLPASEPAEVAAVAEDGPRLALRPPAPAAQPATAAGRVEGGHHPVPGLHRADPGSGLLHHADELVAQRGPLVHR